MAEPYDPHQPVGADSSAKATAEAVDQWLRTIPPLLEAVEEFIFTQTDHAFIGYSSPGGSEHGPYGS